MISIQTQQILLPKQVYIGDTAELRCTFNFNSAELKSLTQNGIVELSCENFLEPLNSIDYQIKNVTLAPTGVDLYQITISFVPWKTGEIFFPSFNLEGYQIDFESVNIVSLAQQNSITSIQESAAPLLLPGTTYKLYGFLIAIVLVLVLLIRMIIHYKKVEFYLKNLKLRIKYRKNAKSTKKKLRALIYPSPNQDNEQDEKQICSEIQKIMRNYLEVRFAYPFTKVVTSDLMKSFTQATYGLASEEKELVFEDFIAVFIRTDYIRFSGQNHFEENELSEIVTKLIKGIEIIEAPEKEKEQTKISEGGENV